MKAHFLIFSLFFTSPLWCWSQSGGISYKTEEVQFHNGKIKFAATLYIPSLPGKKTAVAVTHGSGKDHRNQAGYISFASTLANQGVVVLLFDKRGVGDSEGQYVESPDMSVPAGDLIEAVRLLKNRPEVDPERIGVYGHSQGGWVAPLAAAISEDISFVMVSCGGGVSNRDQVLYSYRSALKAKGHSDAAADSAVAFGTDLFSYLATGVGYATLKPNYQKAATRPWFTVFSEIGFSQHLPPPSMLKEPIFNFFKRINYDPASTLMLLDVPVIVILAGQDQNMPSPTVRKKWEDAFYSSNHQNLLTVIDLPQENHYCFERTSNNEVVYKKTFSNEITKWLGEKFKK